jgi:tellurite methyltransferase
MSGTAGAPGAGPPADGHLAPSAALRHQFGDIDIYLFDQLLKGRFDGRKRVLDAGCGRGRNLVFLLRAGFDVHACDRDPASVDAVRTLASRLAPALLPDRFRVAEVDALPWTDGSMDVVISSAVLHFAADEAHFDRMLREMWRTLAPGGMLFARLASSIGLEDRVEWRSDRRARLPDGTERFLVDEAFLLGWSERLGATLLDPIKTTNVQGMRAMTTWCLERPV